MGCATGFVKYLVFLFNLVFTIIGLALVIIGTLLRLLYSGADRAGSNHDVFLSQVIIFIIIIGVIIFITSFLGCCGAIKGSPYMLRTYAFILLAIFVIQSAIGIIAFMKLNEVEQNFTYVRAAIRGSLGSTFPLEDSNNTRAIEFRDACQSWLKCCGINGPEDYKGTKPGSCCASEPCPSLNNGFYRIGCAEKISEFIVTTFKTILAVLLGTAIVEVSGAILGLCLANSIGKIHYRKLMDPL